MKKLVVLGVVALAGFLGWRVHRAHQAPVEVFEKFSNAVAQGRWDLAEPYLEEPVADREAGERFAAVGWIPVQELRSVQHRVTSRKDSRDRVTLEVTQTVGFNPPGVESAMFSAMQARFNQVATLHETPNGWKVVEFTNTFLGAEETRRR